jgi:pimeloyl-ACP methyl ester carboxylesterase
MARRLAPRAERLVRSPTARKLLFSQVTLHPERIPPEDAALQLRGIAEGPWFDETLAAVAQDSFEGGDQITVPVTVAWGEKDRLLFPRQARRAQRMMPSARVIILKGCGHVPTYDDPEQTAAVLLEASSEPSVPSGDGTARVGEPLAPGAGV